MNTLATFSGGKDGTHTVLPMSFNVSNFSEKVMEDQQYVYIKRNLDKGCEIFYVGIGKNDRYKSKQRNKWCRAIENKYNTETVIITPLLPTGLAKGIEQALIMAHGRRDLGTGTLTNLTNGGDGTNTPSPETRAKLSARLKGNKHSLGRVMPEHEKIARSIANKGMKRTEENKKKYSITKLGSKNPNFDPTIHKWVNEFTGEVVFATCNEMYKKYSPNSRTKFRDLVQGNTRSISCKGWFLNEVRTRKKNQFDKSYGRQGVCSRAPWDVSSAS